jgi:hypothetical protein
MKQYYGITPKPQALTCEDVTGVMSKEKLLKAIDTLKNYNLSGEANKYVAKQVAKKPIKRFL